MAKKPQPLNELNELQDIGDEPVDISGRDAMDIETSFEDSTPKSGRARSESELPPEGSMDNLSVKQTDDPNVQLVRGIAPDDREILGVSMPVEQDKSPEPPLPKAMKIGEYPEDVYRSKSGNDIPEEEISALLGPDLFKKIKTKAIGCNIKSVASFLAQQIYYSLETGIFSGVDATEARVADDENDDFPINKNILQVLGQSNFSRLKAEALGRNKSNHSVLVSGIKRLVDQNIL